VVDKLNIKLNIKYKIKQKYNLTNKKITVVNNLHT